MAKNSMYPRYSLYEKFKQATIKIPLGERIPKPGEQIIIEDSDELTSSEEEVYIKEVIDIQSYNNNAGVLLTIKY